MKSVRFDLENCDALCFTDHRYFTENPHDFTEWKRQQLGPVAYSALMLRANLPNRPDYKIIEMWVDQELKKTA